MESACKSGAEITGDAIHRVGKYSFSNLKNNKTSPQGVDGKPQPKRDPISCYYCGNQIVSSIAKYRAECPAKNVKCHNCGKTGHFVKLCQSHKAVRQNDIEKDSGTNGITKNRMHHITSTFSVLRNPVDCPNQSWSLV